MQGSVRKRGTTWSYRIDFGKIDGKRRQIEKGGYKNKKEADKALADALYQVNNYGEFVENQKITSSEVFDEFITTEAPATRAYATIKRYNSLYRNHYQGKFGGLFVYQISANMVNDFSNIDEFVVWLFVTYDAKNALYKVNIRSRGPVINEIAAKYNGGGHKFASGVRNTDKSQIEELLKDLSEACREYLEKDDKNGNN